MGVLSRVWGCFFIIKEPRETGRTDEAELFTCQHRRVTTAALAALRSAAVYDV